MEHSTQEEGHHVLLIVARVPQEVPYAIINIVIVSYRHTTAYVHIAVCSHYWCL